MFSSAATFAASSLVLPQRATTLKPYDLKSGTYALTEFGVPTTPKPGSIFLMSAAYAVTIKSCRKDTLKRPPKSIIFKEVFFKSTFLMFLNLRMLIVTDTNVLVIKLPNSYTLFRMYFRFILHYTTRSDCR